ncbi:MULTISPECIES: DEAD/DEAH box helicase [Gordonibacter]|uniref:DEAD/DEAH box helicase n=1 Tax=Gordonibacter faecis TaxID=3047475 RepID=A0ABT7DML6_9ACTN|nr:MULTISPECIES: DEAD/DEAH box helicase [unclassified Gordonibacter]MDJ1650785.1 DEAD/DEAH box helicase [Gordonibacter sp. KGMB12511]HIW77185.1 DEAD/DEAH box helicase [Candidatus Gordonibacter avicola]
MDAATPCASDAFDRFSDAVRSWFLNAFRGPTPVQERAWEAIGAGENALVIAPTGSGKTLAAFLFALDKLMAEKAERGAQKRAKGVRVLYVSPLKALGADVERNLQEPLAGIAARCAAAGTGAPNVRTALRTGDTTPDQRRAIQRNPPDILITTPESLYLMLTSKAREVLRTVETVIVDEVHALAGNKRGAHLALSLERLDDLLERPAQRIGLSATVRPREEVAHFLGGPHPVQIVAAEDRPSLDVHVEVPVHDMTAVPAFGGFEAEGLPPAGARGRGQGAARSPRRAATEVAWKSDRALRAVMDGQRLKDAPPDSRLGSSSIWPYVESAILDEVLAHRTTIVFVNSRGLCEKLTARLNELYAKRQGLLAGAPDGAGAAAMRSDMGSTSELVQPPVEVIAKAHHGSVSKEKRLQVERELKAGELPCVVATSSLELGIDMGSIDLVLQVAAPPSVASGLQRIGRANHQVGGRSTGTIFPRTRTEIIDAAVVAEGMRTGAIEATALVRNPLDVLAQQTVAAVAMGDITADAWYDTVRRAAPFSELPRRAFDGVLDMLSGRYASADLAEFSPRIVWNRETGELTPRPGAQRLAVTAAGTIPDRGMFSVVLPEGDGNEGRRRVGELDEEMVYESRVGDIITLGTSSWRISEITRDRVVVEPAPGRSARLPFWHGEGVGRPAEMGRARGAFLRAVDAGLEDGREGEGEDAERAANDGLVLTPALAERLSAAGLDEDAQRNLASLVREQRTATGVVPNDRTLVVERCEDETGDWRVMLHSPYGRRVHEPWAMAVSDRVTSTLGFDPQAQAADDGIVLRIPMTETRLPGAELFVFDADELERIVRDRVDATALFAARFRECAARALLMSPTQPGKRAPLWQQRLKAGQLLEAARGERDFPLMLETARECLQDVYDLGALREVMQGIGEGAVRIVEAQTSVPSPFAAPLLFGYVGEHLYQGDLPHAERRASLLAVDPALLGELLGSTDVGELLDPQVGEAVEAELQRLAPGRRARGAEGVADMLRVLGPLSAEEVACRLEPAASESVRDGAGDEADDADDVPCATVVEAQAALEDLARDRRAFSVLIGGAERWAAVEDAWRLHEALGVAVPDEVPAVFRAAGDDAAVDFPLDDLLLRYARTHGPFSSENVAERFGLGPAVAREALRRLAAAGRLVQGHFAGPSDQPERTWVAADVLRRLRARSLAKARAAVRAVPADAYARYVLDLQGVGAGRGGGLEGIEGVAQVIAQFEGVFLPAVSWEDHVLPSRVRDYRPALLDELIASGEVVWAGARREAAGPAADAPAARGRAARGSAPPVGLVAFYPTDSPLAPARPEPADVGAEEAEPAVCPSVEEAVVQVLGNGYGLFFRQIVEAVRRRMAPERVDETTIAAALQGLVWSGRATNDTFAPVRAAEAGAHAHPAPQRRVSSRRSRHRSGSRLPARTAGMTAAGSAADSVLLGTAGGAALAGRWSLLAPSPENDTVRAVAVVESILDRYGVLSRDVVMLSGVPGGLGALMPVLRSMEDVGDVLRGAFVKGLGPAQFASRETVDVLRTYAATSENAREDAAVPDVAGESACVVLAVDDPANLYGVALPWSAIAEPDGYGDAVSGESDVRPSRRAGSLVVLHNGAAVLYATAGLRALLSFTSDEDILAAAVHALVAHLEHALRRAGGDSARKKMVVETFNGKSVLSSPFADVLQALGLVRLPDGLRLYVDPFARS